MTIASKWQILQDFRNAPGNTIVYGDYLNAPVGDRKRYMALKLVSRLSDLKNFGYDISDCLNPGDLCGEHRWELRNPDYVSFQEAEEFGIEPKGQGVFRKKRGKEPRLEPILPQLPALRDWERQGSLFR